ncbi:MAG: DNA internalization-related competence protein ComEC/Rec2 [Pseudomonadota bacterium]
MTVFFRPLRPVACYLFLALVIGVLFANFLPDLRIFVGIILVVFFIFFYFFKQYRFLILLCIFICIGCYNFQNKLYFNPPENHISHYLDSDKFIITAKVVSLTKNYEQKHRTTIECQKLSFINGKSIKVSGKINLSLILRRNGAIDDLPKFNDTIVFQSKIKSIRNFNNPGHFDYQKHLYLQGIFGTAYTTTDKITILLPAQGKTFLTRWVQKIEWFRNDFSAFVLKQTNHSDQGNILVSLVTGKKELISSELRDLFSKAGISHLLAISGLHLSIVGLIFYWMLYQSFCQISYLGPSGFKKMLVSGRCKKIAGILTLIPLLFYTGFSGFSPSAQRAFIMTAVFLISIVFENETDTLSSLSIAGIIILIIDCTALFSISFQLSFVAVYFIISGLSLFRVKKTAVSKPFVSKLFVMCLVTLFAGLGTSPLTAHYFNIVSFVQLFTNLIAIPIMGFIVLPLGFMALALFLFFPFAAAIIVQLSNVCLMAIISFSQYLTVLPFAWSRIAHFQLMDIISMYFLFICIISWLKNHKKKYFYLMSIPLLWFGSVQVHTWVDNGPTGRLLVSTLDVGQGFCSLIQGPDKTNILVDGGGFTSFTSFDPGRYIVAPFLWKKKITSLNTVILSHPESDHLNGLIYILNNFTIKTLIKNTDIKESKAYEKLITICKTKGIHIVHPKFYPKKYDIGKMAFTFFDETLKEENFNNNSLVFKLSFNKFSMLFPGDILKERENKLSNEYLKHLQSNVLIAPHHGSSTSSRKIFLDKVEPESVIISCGWQNRYGFPHQSVLNRYKTLGMNIYRTDKNGAIFTFSDGETYQITTYRDQ